MVAPAPLNPRSVAECEIVGFSMAPERLPGLWQPSNPSSTEKQNFVSFADARKRNPKALSSSNFSPAVAAFFCDFLYGCRYYRHVSFPTIRRRRWIDSGEEETYGWNLEMPDAHRARGLRSGSAGGIIDAGPAVYQKCRHMRALCRGGSNRCELFRIAAEPSERL